MGRTAPAPDIPPTPGMCPHVVVKAGGSQSGGSGGKGAGSGGGGSGGGPGGDGDGAGGGDPGAASGSPDGSKYKKQKGESDPVDVATGRVYTHPFFDLSIPGPLPLHIERVYSSHLAHRDVGLGYGWTHSLGWRVEVKTHRVRVWTETGVWIELPKPDVDHTAQGPYGWLLTRNAQGYVLDADDGVFREFFETAPNSDEHLLTSVRDRQGNRISLKYEGARLWEATDSVGRVIRFESTDSVHITGIDGFDASSQQWARFYSYGYDEQGNLASATDAEGHAGRYRYDARHLLTEQTDRNGLSFHFVYDRQSRCVEAWGSYVSQGDPALDDGLPALLADGRTRAKGIHHRKFEYHPDGFTEVVTPTQVKQSYCNALGTEDKGVNGGCVTSAEYDDAGHMVSETNEEGATNQYTRDARGRLLSRTDPLGRVVAYERDRWGLMLRIVDPAGGATVIERDPNGNALVATNPLGEVQSFKYGERGQLIEQHETDGSYRTLTRDAHGNVVEVTRGPGAKWIWEYDFWGRVTKFTDAAGASTSYSYSPRGDTIAKSFGHGGEHRYEYSPERQLTRFTDALGASEHYRWGSYNKLCEARDGLGRSVRLRYGLDGELLRVINQRGEEWRFGYDATGVLTEETSFDGRRYQYRCDPVGRRTRTETGSGEITDLEYNLAGELVTKTFHDGSSQSFTYDVRGFLQSAGDDRARCELERDARGRVITETQLVDGERFVVNVEYDAAGRRAARKTSHGHTWNLTQASASGPAQLTLDDVESVHSQHDVFGRETLRMFAGGAKLESHYGDDGYLASRSVATSSGHASTECSYRYDLRGDLKHVTDSLRGVTNFEHDVVGRLISATSDDGKHEAFAYDETDNHAETHDGAQARTYGAGDRLLRCGDTEYRWNDEGRTVEKHDKARGVSTYTWDPRGMLGAVLTPEGKLVEFEYDAFDRRTLKRVSERDGASWRLTAVTQYWWDRHVPVHECRTSRRANGDAVVEERSYVFDGDDYHPVAQRETTREAGRTTDTGWLYFVNNPAGRPERLIDSSGAVVRDLRHDVWGFQSDASEGPAVHIRAQGQMHDPETGLTYNRSRYYDPSCGRFINADPSGVLGGLNAFAFATDPTLESDPTGELKNRHASASERAAINARADDYLDGGALDQGMRAAHKEGVLRDNMNCGSVVDAARRDRLNRGQPPGSDTMVTGGMGANLETHDGKKWDNHRVLETDPPDGPVYDVDQGREFKNRSDFVTATFKNDNVQFNTDKHPPHAEDYRSDERKKEHATPKK